MMIMMMSNNTKKAVQVLALAAIAIAIVTPTTIPTAMATHYEKPPCQADETAVLIQGVDGTFCAPACKDDDTDDDTNPCPTDVPSGVKLTPQCILNSPSGGKYCAILCNAVGNAGSCGSEMQCAPIPHNSNRIGLCDYAIDSNNSDQDQKEDPAALLLRSGVSSSGTTKSKTRHHEIKQSSLVNNEMQMTIDLSVSGFDDDIEVAIDVIES
mmetsp:Transcript_24096/g.25852  ORF Transcript_24096/g.25852 Transcript_24096/m.25852 type:complete len:211 (+) Transcript_24096:46-678(+)